MSLKQSIVIVNQYSTPKPGGRGSRGGTPGRYVLRYMARPDAVETVTPIRKQAIDDFVLRYMTRREAVESVPARKAHTPDEVERTMHERSQGLGGVAFGYGEVSLSDDQIRAASADIQRLFEQEQRTVMKTVISFDNEYLQHHGIVPKDFAPKKEGDYRGVIDQLKLRLAVMEGLEKLSRSQYDDLRYVGVIQVDTMHVHAHLAMVDAGEGHVMDDGFQRGKLGDRAKMLMRRGMDASLDEMQQMKHLSSAVRFERANVTTFVKHWAHQQMLRESLPQLLIATLPEDRKLWRAGTNRADMRKANELVRELVEEVLERPDSPMIPAMDAVREYADQRREDEELTPLQHDALMKEGRRRVIERGMNAVYGSLRSVPDSALAVRTPMLEAMAMDFDELALRAQEEKEKEDAQAAMIRFAFRMRSMALRLAEHRRQRDLMRERLSDWEASRAAGVASDDSLPLAEFYRVEEEYRSRCVAKYRHFLPVTEQEERWYDNWEEVEEYGERLVSLQTMSQDRSLRQMKDPDEAERLGIEIYGQRGGALVAIGDLESRATLEHRVEQMKEGYVRRVEDLRASLAGRGLVLSEDERVGAERAQERVQAGLADPRELGVITAVQIGPGIEHEFEDVRGLDLHVMTRDFSEDVEVGREATDQFRTWEERRREALDGALGYVISSDQLHLREHLPLQDVQLMSHHLGSMEIREDGTSTLRSRTAELRQRGLALAKSRTIRLSERVGEQLEADLVSEMATAASTDPRELVEGPRPVRTAADRRREAEQEVREPGQ